MDSGVVLAGGAREPDKGGTGMRRPPQGITEKKGLIRKQLTVHARRRRRRRRLIAACSFTNIIG